jgi:AraC-like DNA-binding protein
VRGYSMRLVQAFARSLAQQPGFPLAPLDQLSATDPEARIPLALAHRMLDDALERTGDPTLGLTAGTSVSLGDGGAIDYAMSSAATVRDAMTIAARYWPLINDAVELRLEIDGSRAFLKLVSEVALPAAAEDFMLGAVFKNHLRALPGGGDQLECWLEHGAPVDPLAYERAFAPASVRFGAPACGFAFRAEFLDTPLSSADPKLHGVVRAHAENLLSERPSSKTVTDAVQHRLLGELCHGNPTAGHVAAQLHMSARTLERKLAAEGTTFKNLLDDLRRRLALGYVSDQSLALAEIAFLLGFSQPAAFHRAFKRWTSQTPLEYRRSWQR